MYSTDWCGSCRTTKSFLQNKNVVYQEINIDRDEEAAHRVIEWSGGRRVVPTFEIQAADGDLRQIILHNPSLGHLAKVLEITEGNENEKH